MREKNLHSGIYSGWLRHRRFSPKSNQFMYRVFMMYVDLSELEQLLALSPFWSTRFWALARFKRADFFGDANVDLATSIRAKIHEETGLVHSGSIRMLANFRYFGFQINPITTFYCFDRDNSLQFIVSEVTNTPWGERQSYVLRCNPNKHKQRINFQKEMHVSPFNPMDMHYHWYSNTPSRHLLLHIETHQHSDRVLDATLSLKRSEVTSASLNKIIARYPWMTLKVALGIYWQALKLWCKRVPIYDIPKKLPE